jgi:hypothetical protein
MGHVLGAGSDKAHYGQKYTGSNLAGLNLMFHPVGPDHSRSVGLNFVFLLAAQARRCGRSRLRSILPRSVYGAAGTIK